MAHVVIVAGAVQGASCFGPAREFTMIRDFICITQPKAKITGR